MSKKLNQEIFDQLTDCAKNYLTQKGVDIEITVSQLLDKIGEYLAVLEDGEIDLTPEQAMEEARRNQPILAKYSERLYREGLA